MLDLKLYQIHKRIYSLDICQEKEKEERRQGRRRKKKFVEETPCLNRLDCKNRWASKYEYAEMKWHIGFESINTFEDPPNNWNEINVNVCVPLNWYDLWKFIQRWFTVKALIMLSPFDYDAQMGSKVFY